MLKYSCLLFLIFAFSCAPIKEPTPIVNNNYSIIPQPNSLEEKDGFFLLNKSTKIVCDAGLEVEAKYLKELINAASDFEIEQVAKSEGFNIQLKKEIIKGLPMPESYRLTVDSTQVEISSASNEGIFRAIQTLRQLLPAQFHQNQKHSVWGIPSVKIVDAPKFPWRGMLLDCSRHFFSKEVVKKYIDLLAYYKMNTLHWHLTEDQGWRIAIDKYPKLTEIGAWRTEKDGSKYGGFYSKEDIREIVAYAKTRHINVVPEIELPGHSQAALAAYPYLSCTGKQLEVGTEWGVFKDIYCAGNDTVFQFLEDVLTEVIELFPSEYIHIGGDEAPKYRWEHCAKCQKRITNEGLEDEHELQSYFIKRIAKFLESKGKKLIGWDEILEGGLAPNAIVQSWRGMNGAKEAIQEQHYAIASPTSHAYFDYALNSIDLEKVYNFDPIPEGTSDSSKAYLMGGECNMWTEWVPNDSVLDNRMFPRMLAMAEVLWSYPHHRNYAEFYQRVQQQYPILDALGVKYGAETVAIRLKNTTTEKKEIEIELLAGAPNLEVYYNLDNTAPDSTSLKYERAAKLYQTVDLWAQAFKDGQAYGEPLKRHFDRHLANGIEPELSYEYSAYYTGGGNAATTDGVRGTTNFRDGHWQAVQKVDMEITIDLGEEMPIRYLASGYNQKQDSWIFFPFQVEYFISEKGKKFKSVGIVKNDVSPQADGQLIKDFDLRLEDAKARFVKLKAYNIRSCPVWHDAAGSDAWLFIDEFLVK
ncbi:MAG: family 20 glycosylhydrolase [Aureispira sp.]|nr:family 20 glycosylhydrolase [Aureispira sp.]